MLDEVLKDENNQHNSPFSQSSPPPTVDCCIPEEAGSIARGPGRPAGMMIRLSLKFSREAACGIGPNYVAVHGEYAAGTGHCMKYKYNRKKRGE